MTPQNKLPDCQAKLLPPIELACSSGDIVLRGADKAFNPLPFNAQARLRAPAQIRFQRKIRNADESRIATFEPRDGIVTS